MIEIHLDRRLGAYTALPKALFEHLLNRTGEPQLGGAAHLLARLHHLLLACGLTSARQKRAAAIDHGYALRLQARHGSRHQVQHRLHRLRIESGGARHGEHHAGLCRLRIAAERLPARHDQMHARLTHALDHAYAAGDLAFQRARLVDFLLELRGCHRIPAVEDLVADGAAGRQTIFCE